MLNIVYNTAILDVFGTEFKACRFWSNLSRQNKLDCVCTFILLAVDCLGDSSNANHFSIVVSVRIYGTIYYDKQKK